MARVDKAWKILTEIRADASGLAAVYPHTHGCLVWRRTQDGWLAYVHSQSVTEEHYVSLDALRLEPDGPWAPWKTYNVVNVVNDESQPTKVKPAEFKPAAFSVSDRATVAGGPESGALALLAKLGQPFGVHMHEDRVQLANGNTFVTGPAEEWRPVLPEGGVCIPATLLPSLALGAEEFEVVESDVYTRASGALRAMARVESPSTMAAHAGFLARMALVQGEDCDVKVLIKRAKAGEPHYAAASAFLAALGRGRVSVEDIGEGVIKLSAEIAPGWVAVSVARA